MGLSQRTPSRTARRGPLCGACAVFAQHPDDEAVVEAWRVAGYGWQPIADALNAEHGTDIAWGTVSRHVRGQCEGRRAR